MRLLPIVLLLGACGDTTMSTDGWNTACETADDCHAVFVGEVCGCGCEMSAVNVSEAEAWDAEWAEVLESCGDSVPECAPCPTPVVTCDDGTCAAEVPDV